MTGSLRSERPIGVSSRRRKNGSRRKKCFPGKTWKAVPFILAPKKVKYLDIHLTTYVESLCE